MHFNWPIKLWVIQNRQEAFEFTLQGPSLKFHADSIIALAGAPCSATLDGVNVDFLAADQHQSRANFGNSDKLNRVAVLILRSVTG